MLVSLVIAAVALAVGFAFGRATARSRLSLNALADEQARYRARVMPLAPMVDIRRPIREPMRPSSHAPAAH